MNFYSRQAMVWTYRCKKPRSNMSGGSKVRVEMDRLTVEQTRPNLLLFLPNEDDIATRYVRILHI